MNRKRFREIARGAGCGPSEASAFRMEQMRRQAARSATRRKLELVFKFTLPLIVAVSLILICVWAGIILARGL